MNFTAAIGDVLLHLLLSEEGEAHCAGAGIGGGGVTTEVMLASLLKLKLLDVSLDKTLGGVLCTPSSFLSEGF